MMTDGVGFDTNSGEHGEYGFFGKERAYDQFRPNWSLPFGHYTLEQAGFPSAFDESCATTPRVACIGAGNGADAAILKRLGCSVALVEPNETLLHFAQQNLDTIPEGKADYHNAPAVRSGLDESSIDIIVCAQSIHTMKHQYSGQFLNNLQLKSGVGSEEWTRRHWANVMRSESSLVFVWYYNPDPNSQVVKALHKILMDGAASYASSNTPFFEAEYFKPKHFQPWISAEDMTISSRFDVDVVSLARDQVPDWLSSYSFAPTSDAFDAVVRRLQNEWFDAFSMNDLLIIPYVGFVASGPLRKQAYDMSKLTEPVDLDDPLLARVD